MLVSPYTAPLVEGIVEVLLYNRERPFFEMLTTLHRAAIDAAVVAYPRFRIAILLWLAGIPVRVGIGYRWYSFLFNKRVFEHRKTVKKHEAEYNLSLAKELGCHPVGLPSVRLNISEHEKRTADDIRKSLGITNNDTLVLLHPGTGGSARDWKPERFAELARDLVKKRYRVVITGGSTEGEIVNHVAHVAGSDVKPFISTVGLKEYAAFIQTAQLFISNSTGPLHIAAVVGTPVIGFYPPIRVMSPKRWGPLTEKKAIFVPDPAKCPRCKGGECQGDDCMEQIEVNTVVDAAVGLIRDSTKNI
jgi:heptosyltransferase III